LLRVLSEERSFERVGGNTPIRVDVRLIAATNKDLAKLVAENKFRDDLFFRLSVVPITLPPLRHRKEDIPLLVRAFLKSFAEENHKPVLELTSEAMQSILRYDWPGNVRELRTAIEHGVVMATGPKITLRDLPAAVRQGGASTSSSGSRLAGPKTNPFDLHANEHQLIFQALDQSAGNITRAAQKLGISRRTLHRKLKELKKTPASSTTPPSNGH
jgi:DNA-binding NtrC family response regulator